MKITVEYWTNRIKAVEADSVHAAMVAEFGPKSATGWSADGWVWYSENDGVGYVTSRHGDHVATVFRTPLADARPLPLIDVVESPDFASVAFLRDFVGAFTNEQLASWLTQATMHLDSEIAQVVSRMIKEEQRRRYLGANLLTGYARKRSAPDV